MSKLSDLTPLDVPEYTEGIDALGPVVICDGNPMSIEDILFHLRDYANVVVILNKLVTDAKAAECQK